MFGIDAGAGAFVVPETVAVPSRSLRRERLGAPIRNLQTTNRNRVLVDASGAPGSPKRRCHFRGSGARSGRDGATVRLLPLAHPFSGPLQWGLTREERWRRTRSGSRGSEIDRSRMGPRALPHARFAIEEQRTKRDGFRNRPDPALHAFRRYDARCSRHARGATLTTNPSLILVFVGPKGELGAPVVSPRLPETSDRRCSYRFCHRDRSASTVAHAICRPRWTRSARLGRRPANRPRRTSLPVRRALVLIASGFERPTSPSGPAVAPVAGGTAVRPGSERPPRGRTRGSHRRCAASRCRRAEVVTECGGIRSRRHHDPAQPKDRRRPNRPAKVDPDRAIRDAIHRVTERPAEAGGERTPVRARLRGADAQMGSRVKQPLS
jgi:hypothetical protein